ncbi:uncharacterized protein LOC113346235 [Papaver somniferum]|uniref:uncharacterized protein LOC113346235 n=1 Tax=Papaver somniferum TaxID=3469 RepID=UPI000E6F9F87|nr:uncharacterized protein LOC113346235 [Papaver somniferum]
MVNGESIIIWDDQWIPNLPKNVPERRDDRVDLALQNISKVSDLIIKEEQKWDEDKLQQLFNHSAVLKILEIHLPTENAHDLNDKLIWKHHPKGNFSAKSFMKSLSDSKPSGTRNFEFPWKKFWKTNLVPKIHLFIWKFLKNGLAVTGNIGKHVTGVNVECRLCNKDTETVNHLFLNCEAFQAVLFASPMSLRINDNNGNTVQDYIARWLDRGGELVEFKMGPSLFWAIWKTRNNIIFNKGKFSINDTIKEEMYL